MTSLNPVFTVGNQIEEVFALHQQEFSKSERRNQGIELLKMVEFLRPSDVT